MVVAFVIASEANNPEATKKNWIVAATLLAMA
jgi:hypothetical protein